MIHVYMSREPFSHVCDFKLEPCFQTEMGKLTKESKERLILELDPVGAQSTQA